VVLAALALAVAKVVYSGIGTLVNVCVFCSTNTSSCKSGVQWQWHTGKTDSGTEVIRGGQGTGREERESSRFNIPEVFLPSNADRPMEDNEQVRMPTIH
jgi:hypothetical protein